MSKKAKAKKTELYVAHANGADDMAFVGSLKEVTEKAESWYNENSGCYTYCISKLVPFRIARATGDGRVPWEDLS